MDENSRTDRYLDHPVAAGLAGQGTVRKRLGHWAVGQFGRPSGFWGQVAGWIMAHRASNIARNRWTVELLDIQPDDRVLEIGFGPGIALQAIAQQLRTGVAVGIDHSAVMQQQAGRRNRRDIAAGRVRLLQGDPADLPEELGTFHKVLAVNVVMFWGDPVARLRALREHIHPDGRIALTMQPRSPKATDADAQRAGERLCGQLHAAGFHHVRLEVKPMQPVAPVCALGQA